MLTGSASAALLLLPLAKDHRAASAARGTNDHHHSSTGPPFTLWSSLPTLLTSTTSTHAGGTTPPPLLPLPASATTATTASSASSAPSISPSQTQSSPTIQQPMDRVCPYPHRDTLLQRAGCSSSNTSSSSSSSSSQLPSPPTQPMSSTEPQCPPQPPPTHPYSLDFERLRSTVARLEASGWYYGQLSWQQATALLDRQPLGTFLLRDSSDPLFLFALSVQTERGPTSIRIHYRDGQFQLDAEERLLSASNMPFFECVVALVDHYVRLSQTDKAKGHVWLDFFGRRDLRVRLGEPLCHRVAALQHLSRLAINAQVPVWKVGELDLPRVLRRYLLDYPYRR